MAYNEDFMNALALVSFIVGIANYNENLSQSDKDDIMNTLDQQTKDILERLEARVDEQNKMIEEILEMLNAKNG